MGDRTEDLKFDLQLFAEEGEGEGGDNPAWMDQLPDDYKQDEYGKGYKTMGEFYKTHKGLRAKLDAIPQPPDKADGYEFTKPEGIEIDQDTEKWFRETAFGLKIPKDTASKLYDAFNTYSGGRMKAVSDQSEAEKTKADELVHGEWGGDYEANMKLADKGIVDTGGEDLMKILTDAGLKTNLVILKAFKQIGYEHGDDTMKEGSVSGSPQDEGVDLKKVYPSMEDPKYDREAH